jgi:hypothetical protein
MNLLTSGSWDVMNAIAASSPHGIRRPLHALLDSGLRRFTHPCLSDGAGLSAFPCLVRLLGDGTPSPQSRPGRTVSPCPAVALPPDVPSPVDLGLIINGGLGRINSSPEADAVPRKRDRTRGVRDGTHGMLISAAPDSGNVGRHKEGGRWR